MLRIGAWFIIYNISCHMDFLGEKKYSEEKHSNNVVFQGI